ncbi:MAG: sigma-70 family RNA polymerase sigma factor [Chitinivibrionia bacterium]|nr:sigma-70 family RNA polymerase sigma factor [Chitinivibrionia bacterium]
MRELQKSVIERWKNGDKEAFEEIVRLYRTDAYLTALGFVGNADDAQDLSQEAFIRVYHARKSFDADRPFYPWFYKILKNHCLNFIKRFTRKAEDLYFEGQPGQERFASDRPTALEALETEEREAILRAAIGRLSEDHREIIVLKNFRGYSYKEIADILQVPIGTVMSRLYYARKMLKVIIHDIETTGLHDAQAAMPKGYPSPGEVV